MPFWEFTFRIIGEGATEIEALDDATDTMFYSAGDIDPDEPSVYIGEEDPDGLD
jgi:hypothetical protein